MDQDSTLKLVTNLDRAAIDKKLGEIRAAAQSKGLTDVANTLSGFEASTKQQLEQKIITALKSLADKPEHKGLGAQLELVEINLPNLK